MGGYSITSRNCVVGTGYLSEDRHCARHLRLFSSNTALISKEPNVKFSVQMRFLQPSLERSHEKLETCDENTFTRCCASLVFAHFEKQLVPFYGVAFVIVALPRDKPTLQVTNTAVFNVLFHLTNQYLDFTHWEGQVSHFTRRSSVFIGNYLLHKFKRPVFGYFSFSTS